MPVLPLVPSMMVPPGFSSPAFSASSTIFRAMRSLMLLPGLNVSTLARTVPGTSRVILFNFTNGVFPMVVRMFSWICIAAVKVGQWAQGAMWAPRYAKRIARAGAMRDT